MQEVKHGEAKAGKNVTEFGAIRVQVNKSVLSSRECTFIFQS